MKANNELSELSEKGSIRSQVFHELGKNPLLTAKPLCQILQIPFKEHKSYINNLRSQWKANYRNEQGSKCLKFHNWRGWAYAPQAVDRAAALGKGWIQSRGRNRALIFRDRLGRLEWFETGRVNIWIRKIANTGKKAQLLANGFFRTGLIADIRVLKVFIDSVRFHGAHVVVDTGEKLPYAKIDFLKDSLGVVAKIGDLSDPTGLELEFHMPKWAEEAAEDRKAFIEIVKRLFDSNDSRPGKNIGVI